MGRKAVEMGRYGASELMRNKKLQKKAVNYGINKLTPFIQDSAGKAMDQLSTKVRPNIRYKTDRKDLDGRSGKIGGNINEDTNKLDLANYAWEQAVIFGYKGTGKQFLDSLNLSHIYKKGSGLEDKVDKGLKSGVAGSPFQVDIKKGIKLITDPELWKRPSKKEKEDFKKKVEALRRSYDTVKKLGYKGSYTSFAKKLGLVEKPTFTFPGFGGGKIDIHKWIGKLPKPKAGWTPGRYKYMGPYNPLDEQLSYNPETGEVIEWKVKPYNKVDEIAAYHDICYDMGKNKGDCDREMVKSLDAIPYGEMPKWGSTARFLINTKKKLGLGLQAKNARRR